MGYFLFFTFLVLVAYFIFKKNFQNKDDGAYDNEEDIDFEINIKIEPSLNTSKKERKQKRPKIKARWIPSGNKTEITGKTIPDGMIYFGSFLPSVSDYSDSLEPSLVDPSLPTNFKDPDYFGESMTYWPSFRDISPEARAAYIDWLVDGRKNPEAYIGYVFLFFYGLERRLLYDCEQSKEAKAERPVLVSEVNRLLSIYGENGSFQGYATGLLQAINGLEAMEAGTPIYKNTPMKVSRSYEVPLTIRIALGQLSRDDLPIPADWALAWLRSDPNTYLRTPANRCKEEFDSLFKTRYRKRYGEGLKVKPNKAKISGELYRPASSSFGYQNLKTIKLDLPDIARLTRPINKFNEIGSECTDDLDAYSRYLGRNPVSRGTVVAASLLPQELFHVQQNDEIKRVRNYVSDLIGPKGFGIVELKNLFQKLLNIELEKPTKKNSVELAQILEKFGYGLEPDVRFGGQLSNSKYGVIFNLSEEDPKSASPEYLTAATLLRLGSVVSSADGIISKEEEEHLEKGLEGSLHLSKGERIRLRAHMQWLLEEKPNLSGLKKRLEHLPLPQRKNIGHFVINIAAADGHIDPEEVTSLKKIFRLLTLDEKDLFSKLHAATTEPVTVRPSPISESTFSIPSPPAKETGLVLDHEKIARTLKETAAVSSVLKDIFVEDDQREFVSPSPISNENKETLAGLDPEASALLRSLSKKETWTREELEFLAEEEGFLLDGLLDSINESAFEMTNEPLFEDDDPLELNKDILSEMMKS